MIFGFFLFLMILSYIVQYRLKSKFKKYSQMPIAQGVTGKDIAERMLQANNIKDVKVFSTSGRLTDHYNPANKTINLSEDVYGTSSVAAAAVAAHECGHAVQHAESYAWLQFRSAIVPVISFASSWMQWVLLAGILLIEVFPYLLVVGVVLFAMTTLFSFITLPVEINASKRALAWLSTSGLTTSANDEAAKDALKSAAYTYVVAALGSLATLLYYVMILLGRRD
ncbi:MAG: zinc metallopeptidase [Paludibacteraceae bacterium]|nr:zinc metallopeptidase [Paludibacteraceae bacterium]